MNYFIPPRLLAREEQKIFIVDPRTRQINGFDIVSYAWGRPTSPYDCKIPGVSWAITLPPNKLDEIKRLMITANIRYLWCDAVCIDQGNQGEKAMEIAMMYQYYKSARRCHILLRMVADVWDPQDIVRTFQHVDHCLYHMGGSTLASEARLTDNLTSFLSTWANKPWKFALSQNIVRSAAVEIGLLNAYATCTRYVRSLFDNLYFTRVWTFQEMLLGRNITMWGVNEKRAECIGELDTWMNLATESKDKATKFQDWIDESRKEKSEAVNAIISTIEEDKLMLDFLQIQVKGLSAARMDIINGGPFWWCDNHRGISNVFSAISLQPRSATMKVDLFRGLLGIFHGLFTQEEIDLQLSSGDLDHLSFTFFQHLSVKTQSAWTKLAISCGERKEWDWIPVVADTDQPITPECFAGVVKMGRVKPNSSVVKTEAVTGLEHAPRKFMTVTLEHQSVYTGQGYHFSFRGCNCGKTVRTGLFKSELLPVHDQPRTVGWAETGRTLVQCATILGSILDPGHDVAQYRRRLLRKLQPRWTVHDRNAKPPNWVDRCVSGTPWQSPATDHMRVHNRSMSYVMPEVTSCGSRLHNDTTASISCLVKLNCGCTFSGPYSLIMAAITSVTGSSLGGVAAALDSDGRLELNDGLGLVQVGDVGKTFNVVCFEGDEDAYKAYSSSCRTTREGRPVVPKLPWPRGRALVREDFSHGLLDTMRDYGYIRNEGAGNLLISRNHIADDYKIIGVCIDKEMKSKKGNRAITVK